MNVEVFFEILAKIPSKKNDVNIKVKVGRGNMKKVLIFLVCVIVSVVAFIGANMIYDYIKVLWWGNQLDQAIKSLAMII